MTDRLFRDPEALMAQTRALRQLALTLVGDPQGADDLVQSTWVAALTGRLPSSSTSWLRGVLRNLFRQERRSNRRRKRREQHAARGEDPPDPAGDLEKLEVLQAVVAAVRGLSEPYRGAIVARFFHDRTPEQIARRTGRPVATVNTHLQRGLAMLRQTLNRRFGRDWRAALLFAETLVPTTVMSTKLKVASLVFAALGLVWIVSALLPRTAATPPEPGGDPATMIASDLQQQGALPEGEVVGDPPAGVLSERERVTLIPAGTSPGFSVTGKVTDERGDPISGARVWVLQWETETDEDGAYTLKLDRFPFFVHASAEGFASDRGTLSDNERGAGELDFSLRKEFRIRGRVTDVEGNPIPGAEVDTFYNRGSPVPTDEEGRFLLSGLDPGRPNHLLSAEREGFLRADTRVPTQGNEIEHDMVMERGSEVSGTVVDGQGQPIEGVSLYIGIDPNIVDRLDAESDTDGRFTFPTVGPGDRILVLQHDGYAALRTQIEVPPPTERMEPLRLELEEGRTVEGRVFDSRDRPLRMNVSSRQSGKYIQRSTGTDEEGRFRLEHLPREDVSIEVWGRGYIRVDHPVPDGETEVEIRVQEAAGLAGRVVDGRTGDPIPSFRVRFVRGELLPGESRGGSYAATWSREGHQFGDPEGLWSTEGEELVPGMVLGLEVSASGYATRHVPRAVARVEPDPENLVVGLYPGTRLYGDVSAGDGTGPVSGAKVTLLRPEENLSTSSEDTHDFQLVHTDELGSYEFHEVSDGEVYLAVEHPDYAYTRHGPIRLQPGQPEWLEPVELRAGLVLTGQLRDAAGRPRPGVELVLEAFEVAGLANRSWRALSDQGGRYRFAKLPEGVFQLRDRMEVGSESAVSVARYVRLEGPGPVLLDLAPPTSMGGISGTLRGDVPERPVPVSLTPLDTERLPWEQRPAPLRGIAVDGFFSFPGLLPGRYRLDVSLTVGLQRLSARMEVEVGDSLQEVELVVETRG